MGLIATIRGLIFGQNNAPEEKSPYPPAEIDWSKWQPASPADARSPCPMLNALCNHHILPHNGRKITQKMAIDALTQTLNVDAWTAKAFASKAVGMNPDGTHAPWFDLNHVAQHGVIEHDVSLSRNDAAFGDNHTFNRDIWARVLETYGTDKTTSFETLSRARWERVKASKRAHDEAGMDWNYGLKELVLSHGETALLLGLLGNSWTGRIPIEYLRILFEQARIPYNEGWRRSEHTINQGDMLRMIMTVFMHNEEKLEEAALVNIGTVKGVEMAVKSRLPDYCVVM